MLITSQQRKEEYHSPLAIDNFAEHPLKDYNTILENILKSYLN